jgi:hypothetical protein
MTSQLIWRDIIGFPNYKISNDGQIKYVKLDKILQFNAKGELNLSADDGSNYTIKYDRIMKIYFNEHHQDEDVKQIPNFPNYIATYYGRIYHKYHMNELATKNPKGRYKKINIRNTEGVEKQVSCHRLLYSTFNGEIPNDRKFNIDHVGGNKYNNGANKLELTTNGENVRRSYENENRGHTRLAVVKIDRITKKKKIYKSIEEAGKALSEEKKDNKAKDHASKIGKVCNGELKSHGEYIWEFVEPQNSRKYKLSLRKKHDDEIWKQYLYEGKETNYEVSNHGNVKSRCQKDAFMKYDRDPNNPQTRLSVGLVINNTHKSINIHRMVATMFIENDDPINKTQVNHRDGDPKNNHFTNLIWSTPSGNVRHSFALGVNQYDLDDNLMQSFESIGDASYEATKMYAEYAKKNNINPSQIQEGMISACCNYRKDKTYIYKWKYKSEDSKVNEYDFNNNFICSYNNVKEASEAHKTSLGNIIKACKQSPTYIFQEKCKLRFDNNDVLKNIIVQQNDDVKDNEINNEINDKKNDKDNDKNENVEDETDTVNIENENKNDSSIESVKQHVIRGEYKFNDEFKKLIYDKSYEVWVELKLDGDRICNYRISTYGKLKSKRQGTDKKLDKYHRARIDFKCNGVLDNKSFDIRRLSLKTFRPELNLRDTMEDDGIYIHVINEDELLHFTNLTCGSKTGMENGKQKYIVQYDLNGMYKDHFETVEEASKTLGKSIPPIRDSINKKNHGHKSLWASRFDLNHLTTKEWKEYKLPKQFHKDHVKKNKK